MNKVSMFICEVLSRFDDHTKISKGKGRNVRMEKIV